MKGILTLAIVATTLVGLGACGSDKSSSIPKINDGGDVTLPDGDVTLPDNPLDPSDLSIPGGLTEECKAIYAQMIAAYSQAFAPADQQVDLDQVFGDVAAQVPEELQGDVEILAGALREFADVMKQYGDNLASPEAQQAMQLLSTPEVTQASDNLNAYFDATCPEGT